MTNIIQKKDPLELAHALSQELIQMSQKPVHIALSGGSTPKLWFQVLHEHYLNQVQWENIHFWWGDERCVPLSSAESNAGEAIRILLKDTPAHIHPLRTELQPAMAVQNMIQDMTKFLSYKNQLPVFDWMILGIGEDGHTASLFPDFDYPANTVAHLATHPISGQVRGSLSFESLIAAHRISFLSTGANKQTILAAIFNNQELAQIWPAYQVYQSRPDAEFWVDEAAFSTIKDQK